jgi:diguanylate cyclase (GGDEF)-like protein
MVMFTAMYFTYFKPKIDLLRYTDSHIGLPNYKFLLKTLHKLDQNSILVLIDIDDFKRYNSKYSYDAGDEVIIKVRDIILAVTAKYGGQTFRYRNGDEFVLLLNSSVSDCQVMSSMINYIKQEMSTIQVPEESTLSFGMTFVEPSPDIKKSMERLELALATAKTLKNSAYCICKNFSKWL